MYTIYNYFRQYNNNKEILDHKFFYRKFSNEREFGGTFTGIDHLVKSRFSDTFGYLYNTILRCKPKKILDLGCGNGVNLPISNILPGIDYFAIDFAQKTLLSALNDYPNVHFHCGDAFRTGFQDKTFDLIILSSVIILYEKKEDQIKLLREASRILKDDGILVVMIWNESIGFKWSIRMSRFFGRISGKNLPLDFNCVLFSESDVKNIVKNSNLKIKEIIHSGKNSGVLESIKYLNFSKYNRKFGASEKQSISKHPQNVLEDIITQAGRWKFLTKIFYNFSNLFPKWFSMYSVYIIQKNNSDIS